MYDVDLPFVHMYFILDFFTFYRVFSQTET